MIAFKCCGPPKLTFGRRKYIGNHLSGNCAVCAQPATAKKVYAQVYYEDVMFRHERVHLGYKLDSKSSSQVKGLLYGLPGAQVYHSHEQPTAVSLANLWPNWAISPIVQ